MLRWRLAAPMGQDVPVPHRWIQRPRPEPAPRPEEATPGPGQAEPPADTAMTSMDLLAMEASALGELEESAAAETCRTAAARAEASEAVTPLTLAATNEAEATNSENFLQGNFAAAVRQQQVERANAEFIVTCRAAAGNRRSKGEAEHAFWLRLHQAGLSPRAAVKHVGALSAELFPCDTDDSESDGVDE